MNFQFILAVCLSISIFLCSGCRQNQENADDGKSLQKNNVQSSPEAIQKMKDDSILTELSNRIDKIPFITEQRISTVKLFKGIRINKSDGTERTLSDGIFSTEWILDDATVVELDRTIEVHGKSRANINKIVFGLFKPEKSTPVFNAFKRMLFNVIADNVDASNWLNKVFQKSISDLKESNATRYKKKIGGVWVVIEPQNQMKFILLLQIFHPTVEDQSRYQIL